MKMGLLVLVGVLLCGCAADISDYSGQPGARAALAQCRVQAGGSATTDADPFSVVAQQQQYINDCMKAKGFRIN